MALVIRAVLLIGWALIPTLAWGGASAFPFVGLEETLALWGKSPDRKDAPCAKNRRLKVAVLDKTFLGFESELGRTLPADTVMIEGPVRIPSVDPSAHGLRMAQIFSFLATDKMRCPGNVELRLYRVAGYSNFKSAIQGLIDWRADLVLHSEVWEVGGNSDGKGFLNAEVSRAAQSGIIWVNAAGNFEGLVHQGQIRSAASGRASLPHEGDRLRLICRAEDGKKCPTRVLLTWNSFTDSTEDGVREDLDLELIDEDGEVLARSELRQTTEPGEAKPGFSKFPRESLSLQLEAGEYFLRVPMVTRDFREGQVLRVSVSGEFLEMPWSIPGETILNPADNPDILVVGAWDSEKSSLSLSRGKPDLWAPSSLRFEDGREYRGSSNSAALVAGWIALKKLAHPNLDRTGVMKMAKPWDWQRGSEIRVLPPGSAGLACFPESPAHLAPEMLRPLASIGARFIGTAEGLKALFPLDPLVFTGGLRRQDPADRVVWGRRGWSVIPRTQPVPSDSIEAFQVPADATLCRLPLVLFGRMPVW